MEPVMPCIREILACLCDLRLQTVESSPAAFQQFAREPGNLPVQKLFSGQEGLNPLRQLEPGSLCELRCILNICYLGFYSANYSCWYFLGPVFTEPFTRFDAPVQLAQSGLSQQEVQQWIEYADTVPVLEEKKLQTLCTLLLHHLTGQSHPLPRKILRHRWDTKPQTHLLPREDLPEPVRMRRVESYYERSNALTQAVKQGNLSLALYLISHNSPTAAMAPRNADPLRNAQNYCIVLNTQLRHALSDSGIHPYRLDRLSHSIGLEIERATRLDKIPDLFEHILREYCLLVQEHSWPELPPLSRLTVAYIKEHLSDTLTVQDTARALTVNANYLSGVFHRDLGMTFTDFVNRERVEQSAALLLHTNLQIQQIANAVGYNHSSYFARQFLRFKGVTPSAFRARNSL